MVQTDETDSKAGACCHGRRLSAEALGELAGLGADWLWETDAQHRFTWLSESFERLSGIDAKPFLGHSRMPFIKSVPHANADPRGHLDALDAHRPFRDFIYELRGGAPECRWVSVSGAPQFDADGQFLGYLGAGRNVTHFVAAMSELDDAKRELSVHGESQEADTSPGERNEERLLAALDEIQDAFCYYDSDDRLVVYNKAMLSMYAGLEDIITPGMSFSALIDAGLDRGIWLTHDLSKREWRDTLFERRAAAPKTEAMIAFRDGRWIMHRERRTEDGGTIGICTDITAIKRHEADLARARDKAERILSDQKKTIDMMEMGVVVLDADLNAEIINSAFYTIWKISPDDVDVGSPFRTLMDINRHNGIYDVADDKWEEYVDVRLSEIRGGDVQPREFQRADGCTMIYSVTALSGGRRLVSYYDITGMKSREAELAGALEKAKLAEAVINSVPNPIFVFDHDLNFVLANEAFAQGYDRKPEDLIGHKSSDFSGLEDAGRFEAVGRSVLETGEAYEAEEDFEVGGIGRARIVRKQRVRMESGNDYVACSIFDVSEMKRRERDAEEARQRLVDVLEVLPAGVIIYDRDDRFVLANRYNHEALPAMSHTMQPGLPLRDAIEAAHDAGYFRDSGDPELDHLYDDDRDAWIEGYLARYQARSRGFERRNPAGRWIKAFDTRTDDGTYVGVRVDITELKEREAALNKSMRDNEMFQNLIDNVPVAIYAKRPDLKLIYVNKGWCDLTGHTREEAIGKTDGDVFGNEGEAFMEADRAVLRLRQTREIDETVTAPDGSQRYHIARKGTMVAEDGSLYLIGSTTDVTELRRREEELREAREKAVLADRAKSEFLANMSHEIRTPMNGVLGMAELLAKSELTNKQKTFTDIIVKSGNALLTIINDILDFSKIDAGQLVLDPASFNLAEAIEDVATLVSTRAKEKDLELIASVAPALPDVFVGDVGRIRQIITNLLGNGVKFTEKGHVLIEVTGDVGDKQTKLNFKVTDTGIGIPEDKLAGIFDKFSQVDASSTRRHEGTGLGLAITARLIELMGGEIGVTSEEGQGSAFWFDITLPNASAPGLPSPAPVDVSGARVLIIDDNPVNRSILTEQMTCWGFDSCAAEDGPEGIRVLNAAAEKDLAVDCVILDYQMPGMTGIDVARTVRSMMAIADTPIIMLTSVDQSLSGVTSRELSIDSQLIKPARSSQLLETLVETIQKSRHDPAETVEHGVEVPAPVNDMKPAARDADVTTSNRVSEPWREGKIGDHRVDVLVAEDNEVNQLVFTQILSESGFTFEIVGNGRLAVAACAEMKPRMILMDVSMPEMNGLEATAAIRKEETAAGAGLIPIIGVTAHALKGDRERCLEAGMNDYLSKPVSPKALARTLDRWIGGVLETERDTA